MSTYCDTDPNDTDLYLGKILPNVWYRFNCRQDRQEFINYAKSIDAERVYNDDTAYLDCKLLRLKEIKPNKFYLSYRSNYNPKYDKQEVREYLNTKYGIPKGDNEMELITNARRAAHNSAEKEHDDKCEAVYEYSKAGIALRKAEAECPSIKWRTLFYPGLLTEEEQTRIEQITEEYRVLRAQIDATYIELECLYNIADTFEQKQSLLQQYNVLKYGGNVWPKF